MYRKYYSYNDMPIPVNTEKAVEIKKAEPEKPAKIENSPKKSNNNGGIFNNLQNDDIILALVVLALLMDGCDDKLLLGAIAFILFSA